MSFSSRFPFTAAQWQELEHQALIFKYMVSGIPIPPDLLFSVKRNCFDSHLFPRQTQQVGWNYLNMGLGRKIDPEPGRCRRTDGKKWRCSKEAYPDSKYCERHMHRGKNRSRKPVEVNFKSTTINPEPNLSPSPVPSSMPKNQFSLSTNPHSLSSDAIRHYPQLHHSSFHNNTHLHPPSLYRQTSSRPPGFVLDVETPSFLDSCSYSQLATDYRNRCAYRMKEELGEYAFFSESSGTMRSFSASPMEDSWQLTPLTMSCSSSSSKQGGSSLQGDDYSYLQLQSGTETTAPQGQTEKAPPMAMKMEGEETQKIFHRFFDEWPPKDRNSWLEVDDKPSNNGSISTTQLSISIPNSTLDFSVFNSRIQRGNENSSIKPAHFSNSDP